MDQDQDLKVVGGSDVVGSDGEKLGTVDRVEGGYVVAQKGWLFPTEYFIPADAIDSTTDKVVTLNLTKDTVLDQGWDNTPADLKDPGSRDNGSFEDNSAVTGSTAGLDDIGVATPVAGEYRDTPAPTDDDHRADDPIRVQLSEEELSATRREVERGQVTVEKDVVSREQTLEVPVTEERVNVTRHTVDGNVAAESGAFEEGAIEIPVRGEEVDVHKQARVREELEISKEAVNRTEKVSGTVRREEARVTDTTTSARDGNNSNQ